MAGLDYETQDTYTVEVTVDDGSLSDVINVTIYVTDENEVPWFTNMPSSANVDEDETTQTTLFTATASDQDAGDTWTFAMDTVYPISGYSKFTVSTTGDIILYANPSLNYEDEASYIIEVSVTDAAGLSTSDNFTVNVLDVNDAPVIAGLPFTVSIPENETIGVLVYNFTYTDEDGDVVSCDITTGGSFSLTAPGEIYLTASPILDYETVSSHSVNVNCSDGALYDTQTLTVDITDVNEAPSILNLPDNITVDEDTTGTIFTLSTYDPEGDTLTHTITSLSPPTSPRPFLLDSSGVIKIKPSVGVDYESVTYFEITVEVSDPSGETATATLSVTIADVNEAPVIENLPHTVSVQENVTIGAILYFCNASDPDGDTITYSASFSPNDGKLYYVSGTCEIGYINNPDFDYQTTSSYTVTVTASDGSLTSSSAIFTVNLQDFSGAPIFLNLPDNTTVAEDIDSSTDIFTLDVDDDDPSTLTYTILSQSPSEQKFKVTSGGVIRLNSGKSLDYDTTTYYSLAIEVLNSASKSSTSNLGVLVTDVDEPPEFDVTSLTLWNDENRAVGSKTGLAMTAIDPETGDEATYTLTSATPDNYFILDSTTKTLEYVRVVDRDLVSAPAVFYFVITATDAGNMSSTLNVTLNIREYNDNEPTFTKSTYTTTVYTDSRAGTSVISVSARDADIGVNGDVMYAIDPSSDDDTLCAIDSTSGLITLLQAIANYPISEITLYVTATDQGPEKFTDICQVIITLEERQYFQPQFGSTFYNFEVREDANTSEVVGQVQATADGERVLYELAIENDLFSLDPTSGIIKPKATLSDTQSYNLYVTAINTKDTSQVSQTAIVRIDTYSVSTYLYDITLDQSPSTLDKATLTEFIDSVAASVSIKGASPRLVYINGVRVSQDGTVLSGNLNTAATTSVISLVILHDNTTDSIDNLLLDKVFYTVTELDTEFANEGTTTPVGGAFPGFSVSKVEPHVPEVSTPWIQTTTGKATVGTLGALGALGLIGMIAGLSWRYCKKTGGSSITKAQKINVAQAPKKTNDPLYDFRYNKGGQNVPKKPDEPFDFRYNNDNRQPQRPVSSSPTPRPWRSTESPLSAPVYPANGNPNFNDMPDVEENSSLGYHSRSPSFSQPGQVDPEDLQVRGFTPRS